RAGPEHWYDAHVLNPYWIQTTPWLSAEASGGSTISLGGGSFSMARYGEGPRTSSISRRLSAVVHMTLRVRCKKPSPYPWSPPVPGSSPASCRTSDVARGDAHN